MRDDHPQSFPGLRGLVHVGRHHGLTVALDNARGTGLAFGPFDLGEGLGVGANDTEAVLRGLPSLALRYAAHDAAARHLAGWLQQQPGIARVLHPALADAPGHAHWAAHCTRAAGLCSILFDPAIAPQRVDAFVDALRLFRIGYSWGGPVSLAVPYDLSAMRQHRAHLPGTLVRLAIGLEAVADLQADLAQALAVLGG